MIPLFDNDDNHLLIIQKENGRGIFYICIGFWYCFTTMFYFGYFYIH